MDGKADLHLHTTFSDGALSPSELIERARQAGLTTISITDHDHTGALDEAAALAARHGIVVVPGVELSTIVGEADVHILGYFFNHRDKRLQEYLELFRLERLKRAERIVGKLNELKLPLTIAAVLRRAGTGSVGRPHIATALVEEGLIGSYQEAFSKYIGFGKPAYEKKYMISPREAIALVAAAGGLSFLAHPSTFITEAVLREIIDAGIDGIEVVHPSHSPELIGALQRDRQRVFPPGQRWIGFPRGEEKRQGSVREVFHFFRRRER